MLFNGDLNTADYLKKTMQQLIKEELQCCCLCFCGV